MRQRVLCDSCPSEFVLELTSTQPLDVRMLPAAARRIAMLMGWRCEVKVTKGEDITKDTCPGCHK